MIPTCPCVCLLEPPSLCVDDDRLEPNLGLLYIAAFARVRGFRDIRLFSMTGCATEADVQLRLEAIPPADVYGISVMCTTHDYSRRIVRELRRRRPDAYVVAGGPNPSALPKESLESLGVDAVVRGEGEVAFTRLLDRFRDGDPHYGVVDGTPLDDLDLLPFPARDLVSLADYSRVLNGRPCASMIASRGCAHRCAHCNSIVMNLFSLQARFRSVENVVEEARELSTHVGGLRFNDDHFTGHPQLSELTAGLAPLRVEYRVFARLEDLTPAVCEALRASGCVHVSVGVESLDPDNLRALGRASQIGQERNVRVARELGLCVRGYFLVGLPHDSDESIKRYSLKAAALGLDEFSVYPVLPYPGTTIAMSPESFGYRVVDAEWTGYVQIGRGGSAGFVLAHRRFGTEEVRAWRDSLAQALRDGGAVDSCQSAVAR